MKTLFKTIIAVLAVLACLPAAHAQAPISVRQMVHQADSVGIIQTEPQGRPRRGCRLPNPLRRARRVSRFLHGLGSGSSPRWTTLAAYRVDYHPEGLGGVFGLGADNAVGLLTSGAALTLPPSLPILTLTEARRWLGRLALGQPLTARDEAKMNAFFHVSLLSREASLSRATPSRTERLAVAQKLADAVPLGMTRTQVEKIFPQSDGGLISSGEGRYYFGSEVMIGVPYDTNGGPFQPENRVSGPLHVYRDSMHYD